MKHALGSGLLGAVAVTAANQAGKRFLPKAPRLDLLGMQVAARAMKKTRITPPRGPGLYLITLLGELISNSLFYGLVGLGSPRTAWVRGSLLGLAAGVGAVALPEPLGVKKSTTTRTPKTTVTTIAWYVLGGLVAALTYSKLRGERR